MTLSVISYNYQMVSAGKTDAVALKMRGLKIPVCNISCGYYNDYKNNEYTHNSLNSKIVYFL